jgi:hypothetical protein
MLNSLGCLLFPALFAIYYRRLRSRLVTLLESEKSEISLQKLRC